ncbi:SAV_915 family protein [Streptomyces sp. NPDC050617]|uniref:SAV_915 family protein n=1 Tax=Streptomyces sp. NPDC050617 TaxID=3154628 RepID=UPI0034362E92
MHISRTPADTFTAEPRSAGSPCAAEDGEPSDSRAAGPLYVPVRTCPAGFALRVFRTPLGTRTAVAFTSRRRLSHVLGPQQPFIRLARPAVLALAEPLGIARLSVDPLLTARPPKARQAEPGPKPRAPRRPSWDPDAAGALRVTGAAAAVAALQAFLT